jgi:mRNA interferase RelE/StbE
MSCTIRYEPESFNSLTNLPLQIQSRIVKKIDWLAVNFDNITPLGLTGDLAGCYKLRVGDYRVIYELNDLEEQLIIVRIGHRSEIYN